MFQQPVAALSSLLDAKIAPESGGLHVTVGRVPYGCAAHGAGPCLISQDRQGPRQYMARSPPRNTSPSTNPTSHQHHTADLGLCTKGGCAAGGKGKSAGVPTTRVKRRLPMALKYTGLYIGLANRSLYLWAVQQHTVTVNGGTQCSSRAVLCHGHYANTRPRQQQNLRGRHLVQEPCRASDQQHMAGRVAETPLLRNSFTWDGMAGGRWLSQPAGARQVAPQWPAQRW